MSMPDGKPPVATSNPWMRSHYFSAVSAFILFLTLWGFSDNLFWNVGQPSNADPKFIVHGLFCLAWVALFFVQANLAKVRNLRLHRSLGIAGAIIATGVTLSTIYVFWAVWKGWDVMAFYIKANRLLLPSYSLLVLLAFLMRKRPDWHKRCILVATLYMLEPVLSRAFDPLEPLLTGFSDSEIDLYWWTFFVITWNAFFVSLFVYDWTLTKRIHAVTACGFAWFYMIQIIVVLF